MSDIKTDALPRTILGVEDWLRKLAPADMADNYAFLFGMATAKLSDAHSELKRLRALVSELEAEADRVPHDGYCDCEACAMERAADTAKEMR